MLGRATEERRNAEGATERMESFLQSIIERIPYRVLVKESTNLRLTLVNQAAADWLGRRPQDLLGSNAYDLFPKDMAHKEMREDRQALLAPQPVDIPEERWQLPGQEERILHTQKVVIPDATGYPAFLVTISEDITLRKQEERLLQMSRDAAVESARVKAEFLRNMSHELRTPLSIVMGMNSLLLDTELSDAQKKFAQAVQRAADGLSQLTKGVLDFSKIESGTFTVEAEEFRLSRIFEQVNAMFMEQAKAKNLGLACLLGSDIPPRLVGDGVRLRQVLTQIVGNAVKFTPRGEVVIRASVARQDASAVWLQCKVCDTGIGIDPEAQAFLFEPFRQGDGSRTRRFGGTGLGLAMAKRIIELMGGEIGFDSRPGEGATFWFTLPFKKVTQAGPTVQAVELPWAKARVLVVEEDETSRQVRRQQLSGWALASEGSANGEAALALLRREKKAGRPFPIVILDMHLTDMDAVSFAREIKRDPALWETQLLVLTAGEVALDAATADTLGFASWLPKPVPADVLYDRLALVIDRPAIHRHAA
jgi:two-component system, sensor histidine kinase and response regulator